MSDDYDDMDKIADDVVPYVPHTHGYMPSWHDFTKSKGGSNWEHLDDPANLQELGLQLGMTPQEAAEYEQKSKEWEAKDQEWRKLNLQAVTEWGRFNKILTEARKVIHKFKQELIDREGGTYESSRHQGHDGSLNYSPSSATYNGMVRGKNQLGDVVDLFEFRIRGDIKSTKMEVSSYWIDGQGTIDPTRIDVPSSGFVRSWTRFFKKYYQIEKPNLPNFGADWLNNLAYMCWVTPQVQNEQGLDSESLKSLGEMRHRNLLKLNEPGRYKLLIKDPRHDEVLDSQSDPGMVTYYADGTPSEFMETYGPDTKIIGKMGF